MTLLINGEEVYANGVGVTSGSGGGSGNDALTNVAIGGGTIIADNTHAAHGTLAFKFTGTSGTSAFIGWTGLTGTTLAFRGYFYVDTMPTVAQTIVQVRGPSGQIMNVNLNTSAHIQMTDSVPTSRGSGSATLTSGVWYRVEGEISALSTTVGAFTCRIYTFDGTTALDTLTTSVANTGASTSISEIRIGKASTSTLTTPMWFDDWAVQTGSTTPLGPYSTPVIPPTVVVPADFFRLLADGSTAMTAVATPNNGGTITAYAWTQISGPTVVLTNATTATVTMAPPATPGAVLLRCTVTETS